MKAHEKHIVNFKSAIKGRSLKILNSDNSLKLNFEKFKCISKSYLNSNLLFSQTYLINCANFFELSHYFIQFVSSLQLRNSLKI